MSSFPNSPQLVKGGLIVLDAASGAVKRTIALQYNPDSLSRSYQVQRIMTKTRFSPISTGTSSYKYRSKLLAKETRLDIFGKMP